MIKNNPLPIKDRWDLMTMKVCKFGGTSVASAQQIKKVASILKADPSRKIVVVSAPGKRFDDDVKVTDMLIRLSQAALCNEDVEGYLSEVLHRYAQIAIGLDLGQAILDIIELDLRNRLESDKGNPGLFFDQLKASGEDNLAKLVAVYLTSIGLHAEYINPKDAGLLVTDFPQRVQALPESNNRLSALKEKTTITVSHSSTATT